MKGVNGSVPSMNSSINSVRTTAGSIDTELLAARQLIRRWEDNLQHLISITSAITQEESQEKLLQERVGQATVLKTKLKQSY